MKMTLSVWGLRPLSAGDGIDTDDIQAAIRKFIKKTLRINGKVEDSGSGAGGGMRDCSMYVPIKETELNNLLKRLPKKNVMVGKVKIDSSCTRVTIETACLDVNLKPDFKNGIWEVD